MVVSAALNVYLEPWCKNLGVEVVCTELESVSGTLTGRYRNGDCTGPEKVRRVRERYDPTQFETIFAYGDTYEDVELLNLADRRYFRWREITSTTALSAADRVDIDPDR